MIEALKVLSRTSILLCKIHPYPTYPSLRTPDICKFIGAKILILFELQNNCIYICNTPVIWNGMVSYFDSQHPAHRDKLIFRPEETSRLAGFEIRLDRKELKSILVSLLSGCAPEEKRIRITIDLEKQIGTLYIAMETLSVPAPEKYRDGIICRTVEAHRENPKAGDAVHLVIGRCGRVPRVRALAAPCRGWRGR